MKYKYKFSEIVLKSGNRKMIIIMEEKYQMVAQFLMSDIQGADPSYVFEAIDKVLNDESEYEELNGNVCGVEIHKNKTQIYDLRNKEFFMLIRGEENHQEKMKINIEKIDM